MFSTEEWIYQDSNKINVNQKYVSLLFKMYDCFVSKENITINQKNKIKLQSMVEYEFKSISPTE